MPVHWNRRRQIFRIMKLTVMLCVCCFCTLSANVMSQERLSMKLGEVTVKQVFEEIRRQTERIVICNDDRLDQSRRVVANFDGVELGEILADVLRGSGMTFRFVDDYILIVPEQVQAADTVVKPLTLRGRVTDEKKQPLPGVSVVLSGTTVGVSTNADGRFRLAVPVQKGSLEFSFVGYEKQVVPFTSRTDSLSVVMKEEAQAIDEVVVTGIFDKPRESYTGAVTTISNKELKMFKGQNMLQTLRNIDPSINIIQDNFSGSNPNNIPNFNIRGNSSLPMSMNELNEGVSAQLNTPLIIMDGFEITVQQLIDLDDNQVQSINIMKDAAATAIYGSRGANGVIVITTRRPEKGKLQLSGNIGMNIEVPDLSSYDLLNAQEKLDLEYQMGLYSSTNPTTDLEMKQAYAEVQRSILEGTDTYWLSQPLRTGIGQSYNLRLEGGSDEFRWSVAGNYDEVIGVMKNSKRTTFNGTINLIYQRKNFTFMNRLSYSHSRGDESNYGAFTQYASMNPYWRPKDENGDYIAQYLFTPTHEYVTNPLYNTQFNNKDYSKEDNITENFSVEWRPFEGFILRGQIGLSKTFSTHDIFKSPHSSEFTSTTEFTERGSYDYTTGQSYTVDGNLTLSYAKTIKENHQLYFGFDMSMAQSEDFSYTFQMKGYNDRFDFLPNAVGYGENGKPSGSESTSRRVGFTANVNYTYKNRYYADFSFREDGSSQFGANKKFAPFWSAGIGWNAHNEEFLKNTSVVNQLQLRLSYGVTGSQQFSSYQALTTYEYDVNDYYILSTPAFLMGYGNENLKWQQSDMFNVGLNFSFLNRRITGSLDYYINITDDMLSPRIIPASTGFTSFTDNVGKVKNIGLELSLSGYPVRSSTGFTWMLSGRMAHNKNKILELSPEIKRQTEEYIENNSELANLLFEGGSSTDIYTVESLGIDPSTGQELFYDKDGNITYEWNANAKRLAGNTEPKFRGNISSNFRYKGFSLNLSFGFHFGGQQYNSTLQNRVEIPRSSLINNVDRRVLEERWYYPGQVTFYKSFYDLDGNAAGRTRSSSRFVQDDNMFSLQGASVGYQLTGDWIRKHLGMQSLELMVNVSDLFYVSTIKRERGLNYPFSRKVSWTLNFLF